ncbi:MAG: hypothetical protein HYW78_01955 [Parcubacteria group bacterium]|nr:hypothetical protein [Parcubacteria group bacterium]
MKKILLIIAIVCAIVSTASARILRAPTQVQPQNTVPDSAQGNAQTDSSIDFSRYVFPMAVIVRQEQENDDGLKMSDELLTQIIYYVHQIIIKQQEEIIFMGVSSLKDATRDSLINKAKETYSFISYSNRYLMYKRHLLDQLFMFEYYIFSATLDYTITAQEMKEIRSQFEAYKNKYAYSVKQFDGKQIPIEYPFLEIENILSIYFNTDFFLRIFAKEKYKKTLLDIFERHTGKIMVTIEPAPFPWFNAISILSLIALTSFIIVKRKTLIEKIRARFNPTRWS